MPSIPFTPAATRIPGWESRLDMAADTQGVLRLCGEFLASFTPQELASLPARCHPPLKLVDSDDVSAYAVDLIRNTCEQEGDGVVRQFAAFFSYASLRLSRVLAYRHREMLGARAF